MFNVDLRSSLLTLGRTQISLALPSLNRRLHCLTVQRYELWKYPPNFLWNSENITNITPDLEQYSKLGTFKSLKQNKTPKKAMRVGLSASK